MVKRDWFRHIPIPGYEARARVSSIHLRKKHGPDYLMHEPSAPQQVHRSKIYKVGIKVLLGDKETVMLTATHIGELYGLKGITIKKWADSEFLPAPYLIRNYGNGLQYLWLRTQVVAIVRVLNDIFGQGIKKINPKYLQAHAEMLKEGNEWALSRYYDASEELDWNEHGVCFEND